MNYDVVHFIGQREDVMSNGWNSYRNSSLHVDLVGQIKWMLNTGDRFTGFGWRVLNIFRCNPGKNMR